MQQHKNLKFVHGFKMCFCKIFKIRKIRILELGYVARASPDLTGKLTTILY